MLFNEELQKEVYDKESRRKILADPRAYLNKLGYKVTDDVDIKVVKSPKNIVHLVIAGDGIDISSIQAASSELGIGASTIGTLGSAGTVGSYCLTVSSASSAGSIGSLGTVK